MRNIVPRLVGGSVLQPFIRFVFSTIAFILSLLLLSILYNCCNCFSLFLFLRKVPLAYQYRCEDYFHIVSNCYDAILLRFYCAFLADQKNLQTCRLANVQYCCCTINNLLIVIISRHTTLYIKLTFIQISMNIYFTVDIFNRIITLGISCIV